MATSPSWLLFLALIRMIRAHSGRRHDDARRIASCDGRHQRLLRSLVPQGPVVPGLAALHQFHEGVGDSALANDRHADILRIGEGLLSGHPIVFAALGL